MPEARAHPINIFRPLLLSSRDIVLSLSASKMSNTNVSLADKDKTMSLLLRRSGRLYYSKCRKYHFNIKNFRSKK